MRTLRVEPLVRKGLPGGAQARGRGGPTTLRRTVKRLGEVQQVAGALHAGGADRRLAGVGIPRDDLARVVRKARFAVHERGGEGVLYRELRMLPLRGAGDEVDCFGVLGGNQQTVAVVVEQHAAVHLRGGCVGCLAYRLLARHVEHGNLAAAAVGGVEQAIRAEGERARHGQSLRQADAAFPIGEAIAEELVRVRPERAAHVKVTAVDRQCLRTRRHGCQYAQELAVRGELQNRAAIAAGVAHIDDAIRGGNAVRTFHLRPAGEPGLFPSPLSVIPYAPFVHAGPFTDHQYPRFRKGGKRGYQAKRKQCCFHADSISQSSQLRGPRHEPRIYVIISP